MVRGKGRSHLRPQLSRTPERTGPLPELHSRAHMLLCSSLTWGFGHCNAFPSPLSGACVPGPELSPELPVLYGGPYLQLPAWPHSGGPRMPR